MDSSPKIRILLFAGGFGFSRFDRRFGKADDGLEMIEAREDEDPFSQVRAVRPVIALIVAERLSGLASLTLMERLRIAFPEIPVIVLGADIDDEDDAVRHLEAGAADYLPITQARRLPLVVRRIMRDRQSEVSQKRLQLDLQNAVNALTENQRLVTMGRLAAYITHEINNPLGSVLNLLYLLRTESGLSAAGTKYLSMAEKELGRAAQITKQTLNFYRDSTSPLRVKPAELIDEVLALYGRKIEEKNLTVVRQYECNEPITVFPGEIRQVLSNLIMNAIEANLPDGRLLVRVRAARKWLDGGIRGLRIVVADTGIGIAASARPNLGKLFFTTKGQRGTGLGLWVTRAIIQRYGGDLQLYSSTNPKRHGTVFSVFIPTNLRPVAVKSNGGNTHLVGSSHVKDSSISRLKTCHSKKWNRNSSPVATSCSEDLAAG